MKRLRKENIAISTIRPNSCLKDCVLLPSAYKVQVHGRLLQHKMFAHAYRNSQLQSLETCNFFMIYSNNNNITILIIIMPCPVLVLSCSYNNNNNNNNITAPKCCSCNGRHAVCKRCICAWKETPCVSCIPSRSGKCCNTVNQASVVAPGPQPHRAKSHSSSPTAHAPSESVPADIPTTEDDLPLADTFVRPRKKILERIPRCPEV